MKCSNAFVGGQSILTRGRRSVKHNQRKQRMVAHKSKRVIIREKRVRAEAFGKAPMRAARMVGAKSKGIRMSAQCALIARMAWRVSSVARGMEALELRKTSVM